MAKVTQLFLRMALLLMTALVFTHCGDSDSPDHDAAATDGGAGGGGSASGDAGGDAGGPAEAGSAADADAGRPPDAGVDANPDAGGVSCDERRILCKRVAPTCPQGEVPSVDGSCYGVCVPIDACTCNTAADCPQMTQYTCHLSAQHCGPFVN